MKFRDRSFLVVVAGILILISITACSSENQSSKDKLAKAIEESILVDETLAGKEKEIKEYSQCIAEELEGKISKKAYDELLDWKKYQDNESLEYPEFSHKDEKAMNNSLEKCADLFNKITGLDQMGPGKKSAGKTTLRNGITSVKAYQTGLGITNFDGITAEVMKAEDPDLAFVDGTAKNSDPANTVAIVSVNSESIVLLTREPDSGKCYYAKLDVVAPIAYGSSIVEKDEDCPDTPGIGGGVNFVNDSQAGWDI